MISFAFVVRERSHAPSRPLRQRETRTPFAADSGVRKKNGIKNRRGKPGGSVTMPRNAGLFRGLVTAAVLGILQKCSGGVFKNSRDRKELDDFLPPFPVNFSLFGEGQAERPAVRRPHPQL